jgi:hypothetical protein
MYEREFIRKGERDIFVGSFSFQEELVTIFIGNLFLCQCFKSHRAIDAPSGIEFSDSSQDLMH